MTETLIDAIKHPNFFSDMQNWLEWRNKQTNIVINNVIFKDIDFTNYDFSSVQFIDCQFRNCKLVSASLISANLTSSIFNECDLSNAKLIAADLTKTCFKGCIFEKTNLLTATLFQTSITHSNLTQVDLQSFNLVGINLTGCNLTGQDLSNKDLSHSNLLMVNFSQANLSGTLFNYAILDSAKFRNARIVDTNFKGASLKKVDLSHMNLERINFKSADLNECDLRGSNLSKANFEEADLSKVSFYGAVYSEWNIARVRCTFAYWDKERIIKSEYKKHEFERIYSESLVVELKYESRLTTNELVTLPILIEHLQACHWGVTLRLKSIYYIAGGAKVKLVVDEAGNYPMNELQVSIKEEAMRIQKAQLAFRNDHKIQKEFKEAIAGIKDQFWPRLLELAAEYEMEKARNYCVLFIDLKDFTKWSEGIVSEKLSLFRGLLKPILEKWKCSYPNMEGDSLRASFSNPESALRCAIMIRDVLMAADFQLRIGIDIGQVSVVHNEITEQSDLEGFAVSMASRLEAMANTGEIIISKEMKRRADKDRYDFDFKPGKRQLTKAIGEKHAGDWIDIYFL